MEFKVQLSPAAQQRARDYAVEHGVSYEQALEQLLQTALGPSRVKVNSNTQFGPDGELYDDTLAEDYNAWLAEQNQ